MIDASYFDGARAEPRPVRLRRQGDDLVAQGLGDAPFERRWPLAQVQWPERTRHGRRVIHLADGGSIEVDDAPAFDRWRAEAGQRDGWVVRLQQSWSRTLAAVLMLAVVLAAGYRWGVPVLADGVVALVPETVDRTVGDSALASVGERWLEPTRLSPEVQARWRERLGTAIDATWPRDEQVPWTLHFHRGGSSVGPNAFALPGGHLVITDELIELLHGHDDAILGVLGHEYGHVRQRHGMRALARFALLSTATSVALGDFSSVLAALPALVGQMGYSREAERQADADAAKLLRASGRSPAAMVVLFERLRDRSRGRPALPIALASHPADDERIRFFREHR